MNHKIPDLLLPLAVPIDTLHLDPVNANTGHDIDLIAASMNQYGQPEIIVFNPNEGNKVVAGNGRLMAAKQLGWTHIAAVPMDWDATTAAGYGIVANEAASRSHRDPEILATLLQSLDLDDVVTGFDDSDLADLLAEIGQGLEQEAGDAEPQQLPSEWAIIVDCVDEGDQVEKLNTLIEMGYKCQAMLS